MHNLHLKGPSYDVEMGIINRTKVVLIDFSLTVKAVTLIFISGRCSASPSAKQEKSGSIII